MKWTDKEVSNNQVLELMEENKMLLGTPKQRRYKSVGVVEQVIFVHYLLTKVCQQGVLLRMTWFKNVV